MSLLHLGLDLTAPEPRQGYPDTFKVEVTNLHHHPKRIANAASASYLASTTAALALALVFLAAGCTSGNAAICSGRVLERDGNAPRASGERVSGGSNLALSDFAGQVVVVNFWASWCGPCRVETPMLASAYNELSSTGVAFLGVDVRDDRAAAAAFESEFGVGYPSIYDGDAAIAAAWGVAAPPSTFVVAPDGKLRASIPGPIERSDLMCMVSAARGGA